MLKFFVTFWIFAASIFAYDTITPVVSLEVNGTAKDMVVRDGKVIVATDTGRAEVFDYETKKLCKEITIPMIKDFTGDTVPAPVFSVDYADGRYLLLSDSGVGGYSNMWLHEENKTIQLVKPEDHEALIKARFVDKDHILLGYLSNEAALYDIPKRKELYRVQLSESKFSDFALNEKRTKAVFSNESGILYVIDVASGKVVRKLEGENVDNVFSVAFCQGIVAAGGKDRRAALYDVKTGKGRHIQGKFFVYATALSPSSKYVAFAMDEENDIFIYNTVSMDLVAILKGQKSTLNAIVFKTETELVSASDDNTVLFWKIKP